MSWQDRAACHGREALFIDAPGYETEAKEVCRTCPVMGDCRAWFDATETWPAEMVVGGEDMHERTQRRGKYRRQRANEAARCADCGHRLVLSWTDRFGIRRCLADGCRCASHRRERAEVSA